MVTSISLEDAQTRLLELIEQLRPGDELVILHDRQPIARLVPESPSGPRPAPGLGKDAILYMAPDFDAPITDFEEQAG